MSKGSDKTLWDLALDQAREGKDEKTNEEATVLFVGSKNSGKTSMILRFLDRDEPPKPTVALEYTFGRKLKGHNLAKDVGHIWELGGGAWLSKLIEVPMNPHNLMHTAVVIVLDLSLPNELWTTLEKLIKELKEQIRAVIGEARQDDQQIKERLRMKAWERVGEDHQDKDMMDPFLLPLVIIGGKYDIFQDFDSEKRKVICKTLRFVAHTHGAHLQFFSTKQEALSNRARALVSHLLFSTAGGKSLQVEHNKPLLVPFGADSIQQIGSPPLPDGDIGSISAKNPLELWKAAYTAFYPQTAQSDPALVEDPAKDAQYAEPAVDDMRRQKDEELERYKRLSERRAKAERNI